MGWEAELDVIKGMIDDMVPMPSFIETRNGLSVCSVEPYPEEEARFGDLLAMLRPCRIVELGTGPASLTTTLVRALEAEGVMVTMDISEPGDTKPLIEGMAMYGQQIHCIQGDSMDADTQKKILDLLGGRPDFVFLDTDHTRESTQKEVDLWWPVIADGGAMGFHDIFTAPDGVRPVWLELTEGRSFCSFRQHGPHCYGLGVVFK